MSIKELKNEIRKLKKLANDKESDEWTKRWCKNHIKLLTNELNKEEELTK